MGMAGHEREGDDPPAGDRGGDFPLDGVCKVPAGIGTWCLKTQPMSGRVLCIPFRILCLLQCSAAPPATFDLRWRHLNAEDAKQREATRPESADSPRWGSQNIGCESCPESSGCCGAVPCLWKK